MYRTIGPIIDHIEEGYTDMKMQALDFLFNFDFSESEVVVQPIKYARYVATCNSISLYYDYGAHYYFFVKEIDYELGAIIPISKGRKVAVEEAEMNSCRGCVGRDEMPLCNKLSNHCIPSCRKDGKNVIFSLVEE